MLTVHTEVKPKLIAHESRIFEVVGGATQNGTKVPSKHRFVGREHKQGLFNAWRNRLASIAQLKRRNKGLEQRDIEAAILDELDERDRKINALIIQLQANRHEGDTGPIPIGGGAVSHRGFGGGLFAVGTRRAA